MKITNKFNLPEPVYLALTKDEYSKGESNRSVTQLTSSPRIRILNHEYRDRVEKDVSDLIWIALGKAVHRMFEDFATGRYSPEERLFTEIDGWVISGQIDLQYNEDNTFVELRDYKCTSVYSVIFGKDDEDGEWACQLNSYAELVERTKNIPVNKLSNILILRDWKMRDAQKDKSYPQSPIIELPIPLWDKSVRAQYIEDRVRLHQEAEFERLTGGELPLCSPEERWQKPTTFAVMRNKNKRADRVFSSFEDAEVYIDDHKRKAEADPKKKKVDEYRIDIREAEPTRCAMGYCAIAPWCDQYQSELEQNNADNAGQE